MRPFPRSEAKETNEATLTPVNGLCCHLPIRCIEVDKTLLDKAKTVVGCVLLIATVNLSP